MRLSKLLFSPLLLCINNYAFSNSDTLIHFRFRDAIQVTIDQATNQNFSRTQLVLYALPNGNTTAQTMGKRMAPGDDWHFDIQHIAAQTRFVRNMLKENIIVVYLENDAKSWPQWKRQHADYRTQINALVDTIVQTLQLKQYSLHLNGHSGGGSFIFGYLDANPTLPKQLQRITFLDSNYGYDSSYAQQIQEWITQKRSHYLTVFAYNDSVALYSGKPVVSARGGTWYKSKQLLQDLQALRFTCNTDTISHYQSANKRVNLFLKENPDRAIYHTQQVEKNGFIHSILIGTAAANHGYRYYGERAYDLLIRQ